VTPGVVPHEKPCDCDECWCPACREAPQFCYCEPGYGHETFGYLAGLYEREGPR
jgi:hypothetical protein